MMSQYTKDLPSQIQAEVQKAWTPALTGAVGATEQQMAQYVPQFFGAAEALGGTSAADLSPTQKLSQMGTMLGKMGGRMQATTKISDYLGAQMNDMYSRAISAMQMGYQNEADKYARLANQYQMAWQEAEAQRERDFQAAENAKSRAMSGGGGGSGISETDQAQMAADWAAQAADLRRRRSSGGLMEGEVRADANSSFQYLKNLSNAYGLGYDDEFIWQTLGNTPAGTATGGTTSGSTGKKQKSGPTFSTLTAPGVYGGIQKMKSGNVLGGAAQITAAPIAGYSSYLYNKYAPQVNSYVNQFKNAIQ
jgi:hypothetical protein